MILCSNNRGSELETQKTEETQVTGAGTGTGAGTDDQTCRSG
jgi:hypothetical protein